MSELSEPAGVLSAALIVDGIRPGDPVISPDGRWVAWAASSAGGPGPRVSELWLASAGQAAAPTAWTGEPAGQAGEPDAQVTAPVRVAGGGVRRPRWSPDSAWLFYVAAGSDPPYPGQRRRPSRRRRGGPALAR